MCVKRIEVEGVMGKRSGVMLKVENFQELPKKCCLAIILLLVSKFTLKFV
jgi:hypothetical protein